MKLLVSLALIVATACNGGLLPRGASNPPAQVAMLNKTVPLTAPAFPPIYVVRGWPPITTVAENPPSQGAFGDVGCQIYDHSDRGYNLPHTFAGPTAPIACTKGFTEIWVSNQPWDTIVTCRLVLYSDGSYQLLQGSGTDCTFDYNVTRPGQYTLTYWLINTRQDPPAPLRK